MSNTKDYMPKEKSGKLSLVITSTSDGQQAVFSINEQIGNIKNFAEGTDDRNFYKHVRFGDEEEQTLYCISHANEGCYFRILRYISGRSGDNTEAWIYVPTNICIPVDKLYETIMIVRSAICDTKLTQHEEILERTFAEDYKIREGFPNVQKSTAGRIAYRTIPVDGLQKLLGDNLFQHYYYDYEKVLFIDSKLTKVIDTYDNISNEPFINWITVSKNAQYRNVKVYVDDHELATAMMIDSKPKHTIKYTKGTNLLPIEVTRQIKGDVELPTKDDKLDFKYILKKSDFKIMDEEDDRLYLLEKTNIKIAGKELCDSIEVKESDLEKGALKVTVECPGYETQNANISSKIPVESPFKFKLKHKFYATEFKIRDEFVRYKSDDVKFELPLKTPDPKNSPLYGYYISGKDGGEYHLRPKWYAKLSAKDIAILMLIFILLFCGGGLIGGMYVAKNCFNTVAVEYTLPKDTIYMEVQQDTVFRQELSRDSIAFAKLINENIDKVISLEKLKEIEYEDFYNDLNTFNFNALVNKWDKQLSADTICSEKWKNFKKNIDSAQINGFKPTYSLDGTITINRYIKVIKRK